MPRGIYDRKKKKAATPPVKPSVFNPPDAIALSVTPTGLSEEQAISLQVRDSGGGLQGTLLIEDGGIRFRAPKAKSRAGRLFTWKILDRIAEFADLLKD